MATGAVNDPRIIYCECSPSDLLFGYELQEIVGWAVSKSGFELRGDNGREMASLSTERGPLHLQLGPNDQFNFDKYCEGLDRTLGRCEPFVQELHLGADNLSEENLARNMKSALRRMNPLFEPVIEQAARHAVGRISGGGPGLNPLDWVIKDNFQFQILSQTLVLKIFRNGEELDIVPCFLVCCSSRSEVSVLLFIKKTERKVYMEYKERKYTMTKPMIQKMIEEVKSATYF